MMNTEDRFEELLNDIEGQLTDARILVVEYAAGMKMDAMLFSITAEDIANTNWANIDREDAAKKKETLAKAWSILYTRVAEIGTALAAYTELAGLIERYGASKKSKRETKRETGNTIIDRILQCLDMIDNLPEEDRQALAKEYWEFVDQRHAARDADGSTSAMRD